MLKAQAKPEIKDVGIELIFRFRKIANGNFRGLWELAALRKDGSVDEIIIDADLLGSCIENMHQVFENRSL